MADWETVLAAVIAPPVRTVRGRVEEVRTGEDDEDLGPRDEPVLVWRDGPRLRVDSTDGAPLFRTDGRTAWDFRRDAGQPDSRQVDERWGPPYHGPHQFLLSRGRMDWLGGDDFTRPAGPVTEEEFAGRRCWSVELAPPPRKPDPIRLWVDAESGQILGFRNEIAGIGAEFTEVAVGEELDPGLFAWDGPAITPEERQRILREEVRAIEERQQRWFAENVTSRPLRTRGGVDFAPQYVHADPATGAFDAGDSGRIMLARRPRAAEQWTPNWGEAVTYVWSTSGWDWAAGVEPGQGLDADAVADLQEGLHSGEPVDRMRRLG